VTARPGGQHRQGVEEVVRRVAVQFTGHADPGTGQVDRDGEGGGRRGAGQGRRVDVRTPGGRRAPWRCWLALAVTNGAG
jgi:hypothetical protein